MIIVEITIARKNILFATIYRSPSQNSEKFENFIDKLQIALNRMQNDRPHSLILTGDFNCRSTQWWAQDVENPEGTALDELIETNNLHQLIYMPTNIRNEAMFCIDLIITDQPNISIESGVDPSLDEHCQHQIIYGKLGIYIPPPPPYKRTVWDYAKSDSQKIKNEINNTNWRACFAGLGPQQMTDLFTSNSYSILSSNDTSLYSVITDENKTAEDVNRDLESVRLWAWQWKMHFNSDKTEEVIFSTKRSKSLHPPLTLGNDLVMRKIEHRHLGMIFDTKLIFKVLSKRQFAKRGGVSA